MEGYYVFYSQLHLAFVNFISSLFGFGVERDLFICILVEFDFNSNSQHILLQNLFQCMPSYYSTDLNIHICVRWNVIRIPPRIYDIQSLHKRVLHYQKHQFIHKRAFICKDDTCIHMFYPHLCYLM